MTHSGKNFTINLVLPVPVAVLSLLLADLANAVLRGASLTGLGASFEIVIFALAAGYTLMFIPSGVFALLMWLLESRSGLDFRRPSARFVWLVAGSLGGTAAGAIFGWTSFIGLGAWTGLVVSMLTLSRFPGDRESSHA